jgi:hypothetical protein
LSLESGAALALDVGGLILPVVTGAGLLARAAGHADDVVRAVSHTDEMVAVATRADEAAAVVRQAENAGELANRAEDVATAGNRASNTAAAAEGIYEFRDLQDLTGRTYVGQSGNTPQRLQQHVDSGRLGRVEDARTTQVSGGKFAREIAEQNRISDLGDIRGGNVSNMRNPIGKAREATALRNGLRRPVPR